jgi:hypothetical protein
VKEGEKREKEQRAPKGSSASLLQNNNSRRVAREFVKRRVVKKVSCGVLVHYKDRSIIFPDLCSKDCDFFRKLFYA